MVSDFERGALEAFCAELERRGHLAQLLAFPEDDYRCPLRVDGLLRVDGVEWAVDHTRSTFATQTVAAHEAAEQRLRPELTALARQNRASLHVCLDLRIDAKPSDPYWQEVLDLVTLALNSGAAELHGDDGWTAVYVYEWDPMAPVDIMQALTSSEDGGLVVEQLRRELPRVIAGKLVGQLADAKAAGYTTVLLIDQVTPPDTRMSAHFNSSAASHAVIVREVVAEHSGVLDAAWFRDWHGRVQRLWPDLDRPAPGSASTG